MDNAGKLAYVEGVVCLATAKRGKGRNHKAQHDVEQAKAMLKLAMQKYTAHSMPRLKMRQSA